MFLSTSSGLKSIQLSLIYTGPNHKSQSLLGALYCKLELTLVHTEKNLKII